jgi:hypothetical protein
MIASSLKKPHFYLITNKTSNPHPRPLSGTERGKGRGRLKPIATKGTLKNKGETNETVSH